MNRHIIQKFFCAGLLLFLSGITLLIGGCTQRLGYSVIAATSTIIGVEVSQNVTTQTPQAKLGYNRSELAYVPSNRNAGDDAGDTCNGAKDTANVLMELRYGGIFDMGASSGIYQRLAVGDKAVEQDGASAMFLKNADGDVDQGAVDALNAVKKIPATNTEINTIKVPIVSKFLELHQQGKTADLNKFEAAATAVGYPKTKNAYTDYPAFRDFSRYSGATKEEVKEIKDSLQSNGITCNG